MGGNDASGGSEASGGVGTDGASVSVDSLLRDVARAPSQSPRGSTLASPAEGPPSSRELTAGTVVAGRFRLERRLGEGGMGVVWEAVHAVTRKPVALKFLKHTGAADARAVQRFLREARAACAVRHPSVVEVHDVLELDDGSPVMVMELLTGETLAQRLTREQVMSLPDLARVMVHVCSAVGCAHAIGIVHRDLKPENIFLAQTSAGPVVKVLDFGIAKLTASEGDAAHTGATTGTGAILGTPYYMAPEQLFGEKDIDHRADIWALGIIFYEALTGQRPTRGANVGQIYKVVMTDAIVPFGERAPNQPRAVVDLVESMLSRDRAKRPGDASAVLAVLADYTNETFVAVAGPPVAPTPRDRADSGRTSAPVDSDTARASTVEAAPQLNRSGVEVPSEAGVAPRGNPWTWVVAVLAGVSALGVAAFIAWRDAPPAVVPPATPAVTVVAPVVASSVPVTPAPVETSVPSSFLTPVVASASQPAPAPSPPRSGPRETGRPAPRQAAAMPRPSAAAAASSTVAAVPPAPTWPAAAPSASVRDPGSYQ